MIDLTHACQLDSPRVEPFVIKLGPVESGPLEGLLEHHYAPKAVDRPHAYQTRFGLLTIDADPNTSLIGDVLFVNPAQQRVHRWFRRGDTQNTLLVTEQCDQLCIMCSQPPKKTHVDVFRFLLEACLLSDPGADVGLSGGEPTLYKDEVFRLIRRVVALRPDINFHVLSNAQHFCETDIPTLFELRDHIIWGVPVYSSVAAEHDAIVVKEGAFQAVCSGLAVLIRAGASIELRTVVLRQNIAGLSALAMWISERLPGLDCWAVMQLERQGFARTRWERQFFDHSQSFDAIGRAVSLAAVKGVPLALYNFPRCTVPGPFRHLAPSTISDWKRHYAEGCQLCVDRTLCGGLFAWHKDEVPYGSWGAL
jgi:His-Xaa-Ser system radical SAM maturase HxsC